MGLVDWVMDIVGIDAPTTLELIFIMSAFLGTAFFLILMVMMLLGDIVGGVFDSVLDTDFSMDSDLSFELFSIQGLAAAVMMFGYVGMFTIQATDEELYAVLAGGFAALVETPPHMFCTCIYTYIHTHVHAHPPTHT